MPRNRKIKKINSVRKINMDEDLSPEALKLQINRTYRFKELLGDDYNEEDLHKIVNSKIDYWDLDNLLKNGCQPEVALKILT